MAHKYASALMRFIVVLLRMYFDCREYADIVLWIKGSKEFLRFS